MILVNKQTALLRGIAMEAKLFNPPGQALPDMERTNRSSGLYAIERPNASGCIIASRIKEGYAENPARSWFPWKSQDETSG